MVEFKNVIKRYGSVTAVDNISFRIEKGTLATLLGPSGCGKTTTGRAILRLYNPGRAPGWVQVSRRAERCRLDESGGEPVGERVELGPYEIVTLRLRG